MKAMVTVGNLFIDGVKYTRGQIIEIDSIDKYGTKLEQVADEPAPVKKKVAKKKATKKVEDGED